MLDTIEQVTPTIALVDIDLHQLAPVKDSWN